jgi:hypothetical protein
MKIKYIIRLLHMLIKYSKYKKYMTNKNFFIERQTMLHVFNIL